MDPWQKLEEKFGKQLKKDVSFSSLTTLQIGGPIKYFIETTNQEELVSLLSFAKENSLNFLIIGGGSNLLVSDDGFDGLVIKNSITDIKQENLKLTVQAGALLQDLVNFAIEKGLAGVNKLNGIPGTVGGAIYGNAAAYGQSTGEYIRSVKGFDGDKIVELSNQDCNFSYRDSNFKKNGIIILEAVFELIPANPSELKKEAEEIIAKRLEKYPPDIKCPGSFFKNILIENLTKKQSDLIPQDRDFYGKVPAWYFLNEVGAQGQQIGQAKIAEIHGNLFMNLGKSSAKDFYNLAKEYSNKVKEKFGITLEPEVQLINLPPI